MSSRKDVTFYFLGKDTPSGTPIGAPHSRDMTATGSHNHFYSLRGAHPQGKANLKRVGSLLQSPTVHPLSRLWRQLPLHRGAFFSVPSALTSIFTALSLQASGRGVPPPLHAKSILRPAPHPATSWPPSPKGRHFFLRRAILPCPILNFLQFPGICTKIPHSGAFLFWIPIV